MIPSLDISRLESDTEGFLKDFSAAYKTWGFAGITHHGIDAELIRKSLKVTESLFALPEEVKLKYFMDNGGTRGYTPFGTEIAKDAEHVDLKEFWHVGREVQGEPPYPQLQPNVWPEEIPDFKPTMQALYKALDKLGHRMLSAFALALGEQQDFLDDKVNFGNSIIRPLHYPPLPEGETASVRAAAHEDINLITLLVGSEQAGLEVLNKSNEWVPITMIPGTIVCNVGDMLQRLTNHVFPSTTHRVVNPEGDAARHSRYSIPFFLHPNPDVSLDALPQCVTEENPKRYPPISSHEYLLERLREIGLTK
ncbi:isopenicillin N synthase family dioxygenase [Hahella ganghwensis]|uniref:isopenicillin N synthase family dioxygenase n=1 Tax=Hahella ganghwensis TaxID=286420 RepID=UPI00037DCBD3|nr:2-oxoglutarate and iron-dependent oxygenase domain-containing protein [Hahella ganghwensis]